MSKGLLQTLDFLLQKICHSSFFSTVVEGMAHLMWAALICIAGWIDT